MIVIGITGSVGTGKTETSNIFRRRNIPVFDSDYEVSQLYKNHNVLSIIKKNFPSAFKENVLIKEKLTKLVFEDNKKLLRLEKIIYKFLNLKRYSWIRRQFRNRRKIVVFDVPLLFEKDSSNKYDKTVVITCSEKIQKIRVLKRKGWDEKRFIATKLKQLTEKKKKKLADFVIYSDRGKRYVNNMVYNLLNTSYNSKCRSKNSIILNFKK